MAGLHSKNIIGIKKKLLLWTAFGSLVFIIIAYVQQNLTRTSDSTFSINQGNPFHSRSEANYSQIFADQISGKFKSQMQFLKTLSATQTLNDGTQGRINRAFNEHVQLNPDLDFIVYVDRNGEFVGSNDEDRDEKSVSVRTLWTHDFSGEAWFQSTSTGRSTSSRGQMVGEFYVESPVKYKWAKVMNPSASAGYLMAVPVAPAKSERGGALMFYSNYSWVQRILSGSLETLNGRLGQRAQKLVIVDSGGNVLFEPSQSMSPLVRFEKDRRTLGQLDSNQLKLLSKLKKGGSEILGDSTRVSVARIDSGISMHDTWYIWLETPIGIAAPSSIGLLKDSNSEVSTFGLTATFLFSLIFMGGIYYLLARTFSATSRSISFIERSILGLRDSARNIDLYNQQICQSAKSQMMFVRDAEGSIVDYTETLNSASAEAQAGAELVREVAKETREGVVIMERMAEAMSSIEAAYSELQTINNIIQSITDKTSIIHDIVFKSQLLSFNASIEAARAGEYGRGFAIVAAEVGKLSHLSGDAADQIKELLDSSRQKVVDIIHMTHFSIEDCRIESNSASKKFDQLSRQISELEARFEGISLNSREKVNSTLGPDSSVASLREAIGKNESFTSEARQLAADIENQLIFIQKATSYTMQILSVEPHTVSEATSQRVTNSDSDKAVTVGGGFLRKKKGESKAV